MTQVVAWGPDELTRRLDDVIAVYGEAMGYPNDLLATLAARTPSQRLSTPQDVAKLIVFLGSAANANLTGELLREGSSAGRSGHVT